MIFLIYSAMTAETVVQNFGQPEYSYYYVLREFQPLLTRLGTVRVIKDPLLEVDQIYLECLAKNEHCIFLSFTPPHLTQLGLKCPTVPVFAWEFSSLPNETWWEDQPQHDWKFCLDQCAGAIVHSQQTLHAVRQLMGETYPVVSIPAPVWDRAVNSINKNLNKNNNLIFKNGLFFDSHDHAMKRWMATEAEILRKVEEDRGISEVYEGQRYRAYQEGNLEITRQYLAEFYQKIVADSIPKFLKPSFDRWAWSANPWEPGDHQVLLNGIVFTSLLNPQDGRKNFIDMLVGFCTEFKDTPDATLVLKFGHMHKKGRMQDLFIMLSRLDSFKCRIIVMHGHLDEESYFNLSRLTDYIVNTSHGEGQCLPLMEYLSIGKPAVAPRHSALEDYIDETVAFVVDSWEDATTWPHDPRVAYRTLRHDINFESLCAAYRRAYDCKKNNLKLYQEMSHNATVKLKNHCSIAVAESRIKSFFDTIKI